MFINKLAEPLHDDQGNIWRFYITAATYAAAGAIKQFFNENDKILAGTTHLKTDNGYLRVVLLQSNEVSEDLQAKIDTTQRMATEKPYNNKDAEELYQSVKKIFEDTNDIHIASTASLEEQRSKHESKKSIPQEREGVRPV